MAELELSARTRVERGRHVRAQRRRGQVPAVLYGRNQPAQAISTDAAALARVLERAGRTHLIELAIDDQGPRKVLLRDYQIDPRTARPLHADFFAVNLRERLTVDIPLVPVGDPPAVSQLRIGLLQQVLSTLRVEALPGDLPPQLTVDVSGLVEVDQAVRVRDVELPRGMTLAGHVDPDEVVVKIAQLRVAAAEEGPAAAPEAGQAEAGAAEGQREAD